MEYAWGLFGPIARLDLTNPSNNRYYIRDALGHTRLLLDSTGIVKDSYVYDAWGNLLKGSDLNTPNPFTWNGAYGYEWIEFTGLFHVGAREYDPRTARWLQRDPIGVGGGHPNVYLYCGNEPVNGVDPSGLQEEDDPTQAIFKTNYTQNTPRGAGKERAQKAIGQVKTWTHFILECFALTQAAKLYYGRDCSGQPLTPGETVATAAQLGLALFGFGAIGAVMGHGDEAAQLAKATFASGKLQSHFVKHATKVGASTASEYLQKARDLITRRHLFVFTHTTKSGDRYFYDMLTNEFAVLAPDCMTIRTYFTPRDGWNYWTRQLQK